jgi:outer membrane immunogenic protein
MRYFKTLILFFGVAVPLPVLAQAQPFSWTGFYAGAHLGYGFGQPTNPAIGFSDPAGIGVGSFLEGGGFNISPYPNKGILGGVQVGYNYQLSPLWVVGAEGDWSFTDINGSYSATSFPDPAMFGGTYSVSNVRTSLDWLATLRARVGVTSDNWLFYGTSGLALGRVTSSFDSYVNIPGIPYNFSFNGANSTTNVGWTAGAGTEYAFGRWSAKLEYLYYDVGANRVTSPATDTLFAQGAGLTLDQRTSGHIVRAGLNYHF